MAVKRKTKLDWLDEERRKDTLKKTTEELGAHFHTIMTDNYQRLIDISDEEWQAAMDEDAGAGENA